MKKPNALLYYCLTVAILVVGRIQASDINLADNRVELSYYHTLAYPTDKVILGANETAIVVGTVAYNSAYNWTSILYKQDNKDFVTIVLPLGLNDGTMPLSGPGVIMLATNDASDVGALFTGSVGLKIVRTINVRKYKPAN